MTRRLTSTLGMLAIAALSLVVWPSCTARVSTPAGLTSSGTSAGP